MNPVKAFRNRRRLWLYILVAGLFCAGATRAQETTPEAEGAALPYGVVVSGRLGDASPRAVYILDALRGEVLNFNLNATSGNLDPILTVLNNSGTPLALRDDSGGSRNIRLDSLRIPQSDRYYVVVGRFGYDVGTTSGDYDLLVERVGVSSSSGSALRYGDSIINRITDMTPELYYSFRAEAGDIVSIRMQRISGNLDTYLQVVNSNAFVVADNDDVPGSGSLDAEISALVIEETGTYVIIASRFGQAAGTSTGGFVLTIEEAANSGMGNSAASALPITPALPVDGELNDERPARYYRFQGQANDLVTIRMERIDGGLDTLLVLLDPFGAEIASNDDTEGSQNSAITSFLLPNTGTYTIIATRFQREEGRTAGRYRLTLESEGNLATEVPPDIRFVPYGSTITGSIDDANPEQVYAFFGQEGDVVTVAMTRGDGDLDPLVNILDNNGATLATDDDSDGGQNARIDRFTLPATGVYYIQATRYTGEGKANTRGSYILVLAQRFD